MAELNGHAEPTLLADTTSYAAPPEVESTLARLAAYRNVRGVMILARSAVSGGAAGAGGGIVQGVGAVFEGEGGRRYAAAVEKVVGVAAGAIGECDAGDEVKFMRIRTKRHELIITPDDKYILVVLQDPGL
ncbi:N(alpha)-acetyltransferase 38, NatC auxiliary [Cryptotrichosporon argae]